MQSWSRDANQYVADEDDITYSCRVSGTYCKTDLFFLVVLIGFVKSTMLLTHMLLFFSKKHKVNRGVVELNFRYYCINQLLLTALQHCSKMSFFDFYFILIVFLLVGTCYVLGCSASSHIFGFQGLSCWKR